NVGSLLASTNGISNATGSGFYTNSTGHYNFDQAGSHTAMITFHKTIVVANGDGIRNGDIILQAPAGSLKGAHLTARNQGGIPAGQSFTTDFDGDGLFSYQVVNPVSQRIHGIDSNINVGSKTTIDASKVTFNAKVNQDAVLDHIINLG